MAHHKSALKRIRSSGKKRLVNRQKRSKLHTLTKAVRAAESKEEAQNALQNLVPYLDKIVAKKIIHRNKAANQKSKLTKYVNSLEK
jgi:small subunit ribosomal protein S20